MGFLFDPVEESDRSLLKSGDVKSESVLTVEDRCRFVMEMLAGEQQKQDSVLVEVSNSFEFVPVDVQRAPILRTRPAVDATDGEIAVTVVADFDRESEKWIIKFLRFTAGLPWRKNGCAEAGVAEN
ncbi:hypothetical protein MMC21_007858 [Puttea exsequens]|nr:hypothetical protein [Puttea exsequens]